MRKLIFYICIIFSLIFSLSAEENPIKHFQDIEEMGILNYAVNTNETVMLINTASYEDWSTTVYACNPGKGNLNWSFRKIWDKSKIPGNVRSLVYSPVTEKFYFYACWCDENALNERHNGIYVVDTKQVKHIDFLKAFRIVETDGMGYFAVNKKGVWFLKDIWTDGNKYGWAYSELFQMEDEYETLNEERTHAISPIQAMSFWRAENKPAENIEKHNMAYNRDYIFQPTDYTLLIKDKDNKSWWVHDCVTENEKKYENLIDAKKVAERLDQKYTKQAERKEHHFYLMVICLAAVLVCAIVFVFLYIFSRKKQAKVKTESLKERNRMTFEIQEKERAKISRDIHDSVVQDIRVIRLETENLVVDEASKAKQTKIEDIATDCIVKLRNICYNLTPAELTIHNHGESSKFELISIINSLVQQFSSRTHFPCVFKVEEGFEYPVLEKEATQNLFRVIQEALNNIEKHSYATQASIFIKEVENVLQIYITDDGIGCNPDELQKKIEKKEHLGLRSMMDRMDLIGGSIEFFTAQDDGMEVKISLPLENNATDSE